MNRVIMSVATFAAVSSAVVVVAVLLSMAGFIQLSPLPAYGLAVLLGVEAARHSARRVEPRRYAVHDPRLLGCR